MNIIYVNYLQEQKQLEQSKSKYFFTASKTKGFVSLFPLHVLSLPQFVVKFKNPSPPLKAGKHFLQFYLPLKKQNHLRLTLYVACLS